MTLPPGWRSVAGASSLVAALVLSGCGSASSSSLSSSPTEQLSLPAGCTLPLLHNDGTAMVPTIGDGDLLCMVDAPRDLQRGELVALHPPSEPSLTFVKRIVALPGETVEIDGTNQPTKLLIRQPGEGTFATLREPYLPQAWTTLNMCCQHDGSATSVPTPLTLPPDEFFVLGDNRNFSSDSRSFGLVPRPDIIGVVTSDRSNANLYAELPALAHGS